MVRKVKPDNKSQQLAAAAVGAGAELAQAQSEPLAQVNLEQAAEAQGVDVVEHAAAFEAAAALPADQVNAIRDQVDDGLTEEQTADAALVMGVDANQPDWLIGQFDVKAKSPAGFWRCGVQFLHSSPTRVFVVNDKADVPADHDCSVVCCYLTLEEAKRVHQESWLTVVPGSEVI